MKKSGGKYSYTYTNIIVPVDVERRLVPTPQWPNWEIGQGVPVQSTDVLYGFTGQGQKERGREDDVDQWAKCKGAFSIIVRVFGRQICSRVMLFQVRGKEIWLLRWMGLANKAWRLSFKFVRVPAKQTSIRASLFPLLKVRHCHG